MKLTKRTVDALAPPPAGAAIHWDGELKGFGLRITANGVKSFVVDGYPGRKRRRLTIGRYGTLTTEQARDRAKRLLVDMKDGVDPVAERERQRIESTTLRAAVADYLTTREMKPRTVYDVERIFYRNGFADWLDEPLKTLTPDRIRRRHAELGKRSKAQANQAMRYLRAVFNFALASYTNAEGEPILTNNPVAVLSRTRSWYRIGRRQTVIQRHQLRPWFDAVAALENEGARDFFLLTVLTGLRRSEGLGLTWDRVDLEAGTLTIADTKAYRRHTLPLTDFLGELLARRKAETPLDCSWVFADARGRHLQNLRFALEQVESTSDVSFCVHDLRRTFATVAESLDIPAYALKRLLNHSTGSDVTAGYIIADVERLRAPMQKITDYFLKAGGLRESAAVLVHPAALPSR